MFDYFRKSFSTLGVLVTVVVLSAASSTIATTNANATLIANALLKKPAPWQMFHRDAQHTGVAKGKGSVNPATGPRVRWKFKVTQPPTTDDFLNYRWYSTLPLGDLDGDGTLEVVVTTPDNSGEASRVIALKDDPTKRKKVRKLWTFTSPGENVDGAGFDQYSAALADADGDGKLDVLFTSKGGMVRALKGTNGNLIWEYNTTFFIEAGPMIADLDGDGTQEVIVPTGCKDLSYPDPANCPAKLFVLHANPNGSSPFFYDVGFAYKLDSGEPAIMDLDPNDGTNRKALILPTWGARLHVLWRKADNSIVNHSYDVRALDDTLPHDAKSVVRSSPLAYDFGQGPTAVFGWMPDYTIGTDARISAVGISADMNAGTVSFTPRWTIDRDDWKSSVALLPVTNPPLVVTGYGIGTAQGTGQYGKCDPLSGGIVAVKSNGDIAWEKNFNGAEGNVRGSVAVADIDGDKKLEVLLTVGCYGKIHAYNGANGNEEWNFQLGPRTIGTPSLGDLNGDGKLEIVAPSYDGKVWVLQGE